MSKPKNELLILEPFKWQDLSMVNIQAEHSATWHAAVGSGKLMTILEGPYSWTAWKPDRTWALACCGITNGYAWAFLGADLKREIVPIHRFVQQILLKHAETERPGEVLALIDSTYEPAVRWAKLLGFEPSDDEYWVY